MDGDAVPKKRKVSELRNAGEVASISSRVRQSTKAKTKEAEYLRRTNTLVGNFRNRTKLNVKQVFTQREMLAEALETEV